jgi:hypothetical protein
MQWVSTDEGRELSVKRRQSSKRAVTGGKFATPRMHLADIAACATAAHKRTARE